MLWRNNQSDKLIQPIKITSDCCYRIEWIRSWTKTLFRIKVHFNVKEASVKFRRINVEVILRQTSKDYRDITLKQLFLAVYPTLLLKLRAFASRETRYWIIEDRALLTFRIFVIKHIVRWIFFILSFTFRSTLNHMNAVSR